MSDNSAIQWTDYTWPVVTGCTKVSDGCIHCYIERTIPFRMNRRRFDKPGIGGKTDVIFNERALLVPLAMKKPRRIFISMGDPFHADLTDEQIAMIFAAAALTPHHTYQSLTKRPARMRALFKSADFRRLVASKMTELSLVPVEGPNQLRGWPLPNVWAGVSVEDQRTAEQRIPILLDTPAVVRWLSCEPLLGPVDLEMIDWTPEFMEGLPGVYNPLTGEWWPAVGDVDEEYEGRVTNLPKIDWVVAGGESGPGARPMHPDWVRKLRDQCQTYGTAFFFKQWGEHLPVSVFDHPGFVGDRAFNHPRSGIAAPTIREPGPSGTMRAATTRLMRPGERTKGGVLLDRDTYAARIGKKAAGRELDGREWNDYPKVEAYA